MTKIICWIQHTKRLEAEKNRNKDGKALLKLMNYAVYGKITENLRNRIDVKLVSNISNIFKMDTKTELHDTKIFDKNLVAIPKNKVTLTFNKPAYVVWNWAKY